MISKLISILNNSNKKNNINLINIMNDVKMLSFDDAKWYKYINLQKKNTYNKTIIFRNDIYEIILISWDKNAITKIHNHPKNGCIMKILKGSLKEETYDSNTLKKIGENIYEKDNISYIHDDLYHHKIINTAPQSFSLHIYSPPKFYD